MINRIGNRTYLIRKYQKSLINPRHYAIRVVAVGE